ncbi:MAG: chlorophyll synthesis pathway protein BchC [Pseudomonadota bacterium]
MPTLKKAEAVVMDEPGRIAVRPVVLVGEPSADVEVEMLWSGISTGTERLLWSGRMPPFPGLGYPLIPGYESVGRVTKGAGNLASGDLVFVPGARCFGDIRGLFGGAASHVIVPHEKLIPVPDGMGEEAVLLALAATAHHALTLDGVRPPDIIVGHGVLGRLLARLTIALGHGAPRVWDKNPDRLSGTNGYTAAAPDEKPLGEARSIYDVSGNPDCINALVPHLEHGGEIVLAGFYDRPLAFDFPPAFMREARFRIAAEWKPNDLRTVLDLISSGALDLSGLITHRFRPSEAEDAYHTTFEDVSCLKTVLDWRAAA